MSDTLFVEQLANTTPKLLGPQGLLKDARLRGQPSQVAAIGVAALQNVMIADSRSSGALSDGEGSNTGSKRAGAELESGVSLKSPTLAIP